MSVVEDMGVVEQKPRSMTETAMEKFDVKQAEFMVLKSYGNFTVAVEGIGKVEEAHKAVKRGEAELEKDRVELKAPALAFGKMVDAKAKELQSILDPIEKHLKAERENHDSGKLKEKQAKEAEKQAKRQGRINEMVANGIAIDWDAAELPEDEWMGWISKATKEAESVRLEAEQSQKLTLRIARMEALGVAIGSAERVGQLSDEQFEHDYRIAKKAVDDRRTLEEAEARRQAEELRIRAEEIERQRLVDEAAMAEERAKLKAEIEAAEARQAEERKAQEAERAEQARIEAEERKANGERLLAERAVIEADRAEMRRQQEELQQHQAELRAKAESEAKELRRKEREAAEAARLEALKPEIEKAQSFAECLITDAQDSLVRLGNPAWGDDAMHLLRNCGSSIVALVVQR